MSSAELLSTMTASDLKSLSERLGLTVGATARGLGVSPSQYNAYLYGGRAIPQTVALAATALLLGATGYEPNLVPAGPATSTASATSDDLRASATDATDDESNDPYLSFVMTVD